MRSWKTAFRPTDEGAPHNDYFRALDQELRDKGPMRPCMVVDLDRLEHNLDIVTAAVRPPVRLRIVAKSLPSVRLLDHILRRARTNRLMAFHQPFLNAEVEAFPDADILIGKPLPARSAEYFYRGLKGPFDPSRQLQWLIDTPERLRQYLALANALGTTMRVNFEIDVGLHRGGIADFDTLRAMLNLVGANSDRLQFSGFMGYDPHVVKLPRFLGSRQDLFRNVTDVYRAFFDCARAHRPQLWRDDLTFNGAGSPTFRLYDASGVVNDISVGSALLKPTDFDLDLLADLRPAAFIATPVLKAIRGVRLPGMDRMAWLPELTARWNPNRAMTYFLYGGHWMAKYESPRGLRPNSLYGYSTNQEMANGSLSVGLGVDDHVFLRPTQSEAVLLQFGDLVVVRAGKIVDRWPVLRN